LRFEALEDRTLCAVAAFEVNLFEDAGGSPGERISVDQVAVGTFFVEITARELDPMLSGLGGVSLDIRWDPSVFREVDAEFAPADPNSPLVTPAFPIRRRGTLDNVAGAIDNLSGAVFLSTGEGRPIGDLAPERFSLLKFAALRPTESSTFSVRQGRSGIATVPVTSLGKKQIDLPSLRISVVGPAPDGEAAAVMLSDGTGEEPVFVGPILAGGAIDGRQGKVDSGPSTGDGRDSRQWSCLPGGWKVQPASRVDTVLTGFSSWRWPGPDISLEHSRVRPASRPPLDEPSTEGSAALSVDSLLASGSPLSEPAAELEKVIHHVAHGLYDAT
jgi:hypothetical protein